MQRVGRLVAETIHIMAQAVAPGVTTGQLDELAQRIAESHGARSAPQLTYAFPGFTCISVNDEIVHGVPGARALVDGDLVTLDVTLELDGYMADSARTLPVGHAGPAALRLVHTAREALAAALTVCRAGRRVRDIGAAVERRARSDGGRVFRELCGHGIGRTLHETPDVPNWNDPTATMTLHEGLVIAIEPMLSARSARVVEAADGWTYRTHNGAWAVHEEHTVVVRDGPPLILTVA